MASVDYILRLKDQFTNTFNKFKAGADSVESKIDGINNKLGTMSQVVGGIAIGAFGTQLVDTASKMQALRNSITFASGSAEEGAKNLAHIEETANNLGLDIQALTKGFKTLTGATMGTKLAGEETRKIFTGVSEAAAAMGLSGEDTEGVMLALGQMISKGSVQAEELKGQLGERLPGAFHAAAHSMGVNTQKLGDMLKNGEVIADDFLPKLQAELHKTFGVEAKKNKNSINGMISELKNLWTMFAIKMIPVVSKFLGYLISMVKWFKEHPSAIYAVVGALGALLGIYTALKVAQLAIALTNPFALIVIGITATIAALAYLYNEFEGVRRVMNGIFDGAVAWFTSLYDLVVGLGKAMKGAFTLDWKTFKAGADQFAVGLKNTLTGESAISAYQKAGSENRIAGLMAGLNSITNSVTGQGGNMGASGSLAGLTDKENKGKNSKIDKTIGEIAGGKPSSIIINIDSLIKENNNIVNNIKSPSELKDFEKMLIGALLRVTNDSQIAIG